MPRKDRRPNDGLMTAAGNGQVILASQGYADKAGCKNGIESVKKNSPDDGRYERNTHLHRLNADFALTNLLRHSDHHAHASRCYQVLRHPPDSPQLPGGYAAMFVLALFPHLWFRVIHPRLQRWQSGEGAAS